MTLLTLNECNLNFNSVMEKDVGAYSIFSLEFFWPKLA